MQINHILHCIATDSDKFHLQQLVQNLFRFWTSILIHTSGNKYSDGKYGKKIRYREISKWIGDIMC